MKNEISFDMPSFSIENSLTLSKDEEKFLKIFISFTSAEENFIKFRLSKLSEALELDNEKLIKVLKDFSKRVLTVTTSEGSILYLSIISSIEINEKYDFVNIKYEEAIEGLFEKIKLVFEKYNASRILNLKGKYSWKIYSLLKELDLEKEYYVSIDYLREAFDLKERYKLYADLKRKVILYTENEFKESSDIYFTFTEKKQDKKTIGLYIQAHQNPNFKNEALGLDKIDISDILF